MEYYGCLHYGSECGDGSSPMSSSGFFQVPVWDEKQIADKYILVIFKQAAEWVYIQHKNIQFLMLLFFYHF